MANIGLTYNNPGNLTVTGPNSILYNGQTGVYSSPNGLFYAIFKDFQSGSAALDTYISNNIGTDPNTSESTIGQFLGYFLNGNNNAVENTTANPNSLGYLKGVEKATGLSGDQQFTTTEVHNPAFINSIAQAITTQEGTAGGYVPQGGSVAPNLLQSAENVITGSIADFGSNAQAIANATPGQLGVAAGMVPGQVGAGFSAAGSGAANAATAAGSSILKPLTDWLTAQSTAFKNWETNTLPSAIERSAIGIVALILIIVGIFFLADGPKAVAVAAKAAA